MVKADKVALSPEAVELTSKLTKLQRQTVLGVVAGKSQRQAYYDAGGKAKSDESADSIVSRMLSDAKVDAFYQEIMDGVAKAAIMTREEALERLSALARATIKDVAVFRKVRVGEDEHGAPVHQTVWEVKGSDSIGDEQAAAISEVSTGKDGLKVKLHSSAAAIKQLADMMPGWKAPEKIEATVTQITRKIVKAKR
ncbi:MAG: terminase small subunit [Desulfuromonadales bacterium]|nr:terminase small subunit [Desulfuromonadales bacterium]